MYLNHLYTTLQGNSLVWYRQFCSMYRLPYDPDPKLTIMVSSLDLTPSPDRQYSTVITDLDLYFSTEVGSSSALMSLQSPALDERFMELVGGGTIPSFGLHYNPFIILLRHFPPLTRRNRNHFNQMRTNSQGVDLEFGGEQVEVKEFFGEPYREYQEFCESQ